MKYLGIVEALEADIRSGVVPRGERLPSQRAIADALDVDLTTVTRAFNEARVRGLVAAQAGRGTFVSETALEETHDEPPALIDLSMNIPSQPRDIDFRKLLPQGIAQVLSGPGGLLHLHYQESAGARPDREIAARWLSRRMPGLEAERVLVTAGAQSALYAVCELLLAQGEAVATGALTYPGMKAVAMLKGLHLQPLEMDRDGIVPDAFEKLCREKAPKALYVIPSIDNPTTSTLPLARRQQLAAIARKFGVLILEDDPYAPLLPAPAPSIAELAPEITWHIATLSKCATPALRVAYVAAPDASWAQRLAGVLRTSVLMAPPLTSALASRWIESGEMDALTRAIRAENLARQQIAAAILGEDTFAADPHGHHLWLPLPGHWRAGSFAAQAERAGVAIVPSSAFATTERPEAAVRISLGVSPDRSDLEDGLTQLANLLARPPSGTRAVV